MPIYEDERITTDDLLDMRKKMKCQECGGMLNVFMDSDSGKAFLACNDWHRTHHDGIEREPSRYEMEGVASLNIPTRRKIMEQEYGKETTTALDKARLPTTGALTQSQAMHILKLVYPDVPEDQIIRTAILCRDFGLHPLMKEVYIIGFKNKQTGKTDYSTVLGINANRKLAADKKGAYSFLDDTPRAASQEEIIKQYGRGTEEEKNNLVSICRLRGEKGNEVVGFGLWPKNEEPKATKGNTKRNMANIRSERQAIDRLPGEAIPLRNLDVIEESVGEALKGDNIIEVSGQLVDKTTGVIQEPEPAKNTPVEADVHWCQEHNCAFDKKTRGSSTWYAHKLDDATWCNEAKKKDNASKPEPELKYSPVTTDMPDVAIEQAFTPPDEPQEPAPNTIESLKETMQLCNWGTMEVGKFCNVEKGWAIREFKDLTPERIAELIDYIKRNPK